MRNKEEEEEKNPSLCSLLSGLPQFERGKMNKKKKKLML